MDPQEAARKLREQAQLIPHPSTLYLRQRKPLAGTSTFSVTDTGTQTNFPPSLVNLTPSSTLNASAFTSGIQFRPPVTPASLSHLHVRPESVDSFPLVPSSSHYDDDPFHPNKSQVPSSYYPDQDLNGLDQDSFISRQHCTTDSYTRVHNLLDHLRRERISPVDIQLEPVYYSTVLDPDDISYNRYCGNLYLYRDDNIKLASLIEIIMSDEKGKEKFSGCMEPYVLDLACETVAKQMETRWKNSILSGIEAVTPALMENWTLDEQVDHSPFLTQILETAAQTEHS
ncbi:hypothetical protein B0H13DRAFT_1882923 [Mycena leptocephala]|nr:hypothetical protein B0H13DRAFT_1882923 [Mycena leptocephala]